VTPTPRHRAGQEPETQHAPPTAPPAAAPATLSDEVLRQLYRRHSSAILRMLMRTTGADLAQAEDILQETILRAWQHPESVSRGLDQALPWLLTVARRISIDQFRMRAARPQELVDEVPPTGALVPDPADRIVADRDVAVALAELHPRHRAVLLEVHVRDRSVAQAAEKLGVPVGTVKSRTYHAVRALRPVLEAHGMV
jgi:RNA polymerase sigma-70 factor (ECF subfamily)